MKEQSLLWYTFRDGLTLSIGAGIFNQDLTYRWWIFGFGFLCWLGAFLAYEERGRY